MDDNEAFCPNCGMAKTNEANRGTRLPPTNKETAYGQHASPGSGQKIFRRVLEWLQTPRNKKIALIGTGVLVALILVAVVLSLAGGGASKNPLVGRWTYYTRWGELSDSITLTETGKVVDPEQLLLHGYNSAMIIKWEVFDDLIMFTDEGGSVFYWEYEISGDTLKLHKTGSDTILTFKRG